jgi:SAM-dependent methyltransferase
MVKDELYLSNILMCPYCSGEIIQMETDVQCSNCHIKFGLSKAGQIDFRLKTSKQIMVPFTLTPEFVPKKSVFDSSKGFNKFSQNYSNGGMLLDLGCGKAEKKAVFEHQGFKYVGIDYDSDDATFLADAHALPFKSGSFDFIYSTAVLEHLQYPFVAVDQAFRVLKSGGVFLGSVAFLEPFHGNSFYHHTHYGLFNCLERSGFTVLKISPNIGWDVLAAQASMSFFPKLPPYLSKALVSPLRFLHKAYWKIGEKLDSKATEDLRLFWTAGAFLFIATKP